MAASLTARQFSRFNLRTKFILAFLVVTLIPMGVLGFLADRTTREVLTNSADQALLGAASQTAASVDTFIAANLDAIRAEAQLPDWLPALSASAASARDLGSDGGVASEIAARLRALSRKDPVNISSYALLDRQGRNLADTFPPDTGLDESGQDYFLMPLQTGLPYVSPVKFSPTTDQAALYFSSPVQDAAGEIVGVLRVRYNAAVLQQLIVQNTGLLGKDSVAILLDENHIRLADGFEPELIFRSVVPLDAALVAELQASGRLSDGTAEQLSTNLPDFEQGLINAASQPNFTGVAHPGAELEQGAVVLLRTQPWLVAFMQARSAFLAPVEAQTRNMILLALAFAATMAAAAVGASQVLAGPIARLTAVAHQVATGDLTARAPVTSRDEIGMLAETFNSMTAQLQDTLHGLEQRVVARTRDLALAAEVGHNVSQVRDLDTLLANAVELIRSRFDLYYTQIYLTDPNSRALALRAGTGAVGRQLMRRGHRLPPGAGSINGRAASERQAVIVADTANSGMFKPNPLLPDTRSEMAVPLMIGDRVVGVLDLQSDKPGALSAGHLPAFQALAGQLAVAIQNAALFAEAEQARAEVEGRAGSLMRSGWQEFLDAIHRSEHLGYTFDQQDVAPLTEPLSPASDASALEAPMTLLGQLVGKIHVERGADAEQAWTQDERELVNAVAARVAHQVENLRLLAQAEQYRAEAEAAARRLTYEGWESYLESPAATGTGYVYDLNQVMPLGAIPDANGAQAKRYPLQVQGEAIGALAVDGEGNLGEAAELVVKVAERLSAHLENLRLSEQLHAALAEQKAIVTRLRELDHLKSSFLANMSHELRTPLNSILGFADVMLMGLDGPLTGQMENDLNLINKNGQHLLSLINDVLDMAKIEAGRMNLVIESFDLREVLHEVADIIGPLAREKSLDLRIEAGAAADLHLAADRVRLRQVMINLVNNAIKFTEEGGVTIWASRDDGRMKISVRDTGVGIPPHQIDTVFEEFRQVDASTTRKAGGTGLGLPISKRLVELHGGRLWAESSGLPGEGSAFHIELPTLSTDGPQAAPESVFENSPERRL